MTETPHRLVRVEWDIDDGYDPEDFPQGEPTPEVLGLPNPVEIPGSTLDEYKAEMDLGFEDSAIGVINDYLSDVYGFTHFGWGWIE